jgi:hypothetical protein
MTHDAYYSFSAKFAEGKIYEVEQDKLYRKWFDIQPVTLPEDRKGKDRRFSARACALSFSVEYKGDDKSTSTGNLFIEVISVDTEGVPGWALTCEADYLSFYVPQERLAYWLHVPTLKAWLPYWLMKYGIGKAPNDGYHTHGVKVPRKEIGRSSACHGVIRDGIVSTENQQRMWAEYVFAAFAVGGSILLAGVVIAIDQLVRWCQ